MTKHQERKPVFFSWAGADLNLTQTGTMTTHRANQARPDIKTYAEEIRKMQNKVQYLGNNASSPYNI